MSSKQADAREPAPAGNFIRQAIDADLAREAFANRGWAGRPGVAALHRGTHPDPAVIRTRFPPEPNGYLHIGHAKSICLNFGIARDYAGRCHMRFDDTNPAKEDQEFVDSILDTVRWLGFDWVHPDGEQDLFFASDYFEQLYQFALHLIDAGHAYVDSQSADEIRAGRGTLTEPGTDSPYRDRPVGESLALFREMRDGRHEDGSHVLRARIDMRSPNINLRDPVLYRIRKVRHHRTGDAWPIYPLYDYAHPLSDALERITHSLCTLEFEDHRPLYDWLLARLADVGDVDAPLPRQIEFARLNLTYTITSKRKLRELIERGHVAGWDDPRMPTIVGMRRRGYTPESIRLFCDRAGVSKAAQLIEMAVLEQTVREDLEPRAPRAMVVTDPIRLTIENFDAATREAASAPVHPQDAARGERHFHLTRELLIEREDFAIDPPKGFFRLSPTQRVRLRYGYVIEYLRHETDASGAVTEVVCKVLPDTRSGTPGADSVKVKGNIHWVSADEAIAVELRLFEHLFTEREPDAGGRDPITVLNPSSLRVVRGFAEPWTGGVEAGTQLQFERQGWFVADRVDHRRDRPVFNRITTLKGSVAKK
ncbi:MAG: glutamine--tRNA ligase/YqeY domain fusion protein [Lautropia sp.]